MGPGGDQITTLRLRIFGRVQAVGYRAWTIQAAHKLGVNGWVRNLSDGTVEVIAQGGADAVGAMIAACQAGPPLARVTRVNAQDLANAESFTAFSELPTAPPYDG